MTGGGDAGYLSWEPVTILHFTVLVYTVGQQPTRRRQWVTIYTVWECHTIGCVSSRGDTQGNTTAEEVTAEEEGGEEEEER